MLFKSIICTNAVHVYNIQQLTEKKTSQSIIYAPEIIETVSTP